MWRVPRVQNMSSFWPFSTSEYRFLGTKLTIDSYSFDSSTPPPPTLSAQFIVGKILGGGGSN